jgi:type 1 glutamine amidotransferase
LREFEGGRVFFTNLGHRDDTYTKPNVMRHILDGIQYALGDLSADATPTAKSTKVKPALAPKESK